MVYNFEQIFTRFYLSPGWTLSINRAPFPENKRVNTTKKLDFCKIIVLHKSKII